MVGGATTLEAHVDIISTGLISTKMGGGGTEGVGGDWAEVEGEEGAVEGVSIPTCCMVIIIAIMDTDWAMGLKKTRG